MPVSERAKRLRAASDQSWLATNPDYARALRELTQGRDRVTDLFPSTWEGDRGAVSPLSFGKVGIGGVAQPASQKEE